MLKLKSSQRRTTHRDKKRRVLLLIPTALCSALLMTSSLAIYAQSSADLDETHRWVQSKTQDAKIREALIGNGTKPTDPCDPRNETGPYDPLPCIEKQTKGWKVMLDAAQSDPQASPTVRGTIERIIRELGALQSQWRSLSQREKSQRLYIQTVLLDAVRKSGNNVEAGLQRIIDDSAQSQRTREVARNTLAAYKTWHKGGTLSDSLSGFLTCFHCFCVKAEGCPCCGYDLLFDLFKRP